MQLKWGRGFFRAWVVVTVLWILFTGWNEYKNWVMHPDEARANECWDRLAKWPDGKPFDAWDAVGDEYMPDTSEGKERNRWRAEIRQKLAECEAPASILAKWEAELVSSDAVFGLSRLLLPPIALLVAGFIFGWMAKGFRTSA
jgi:hypothetical protein